MDENNQWHCYICQPEPLLDLVTACDSVFENLEQLLQQNKKRIRVDGEKSKIYENTLKHSSKKNSSSCNGEEKKLNHPYSGALMYSYKVLMVPESLLKKTKKLVETTTNMNASFVNFLKDAAENSEINRTVHLRQLKAFKSVLSDIKKAHVALEEGVNLELQALGAKIKQKNTKEKEGEITLGTNSVKQPEGKDDGEHKAVPEVGENADQSILGLERAGSKRAPCKDDKSGKAKDLPYEPNSTEGTDMDIVSVPSSVPEDIFESCVEAQRAAGDGTRKKATEQGAVNASTKSNSVSKDHNGGMKLIQTTKVTKELVVKLTPVSLSSSPVRADDPVGKPEKGDKREGGKECSTTECPSGNEVFSLIEDHELRRSPRVKTTPLRRVADINTLTSNSEEDSNDTHSEKHGKKSIQSKRKKDKLSSPDSTVGSPQLDTLPKSKKPEIVDQNSDSDEVPAVLQEVAMMSHSSSDIDSNSEIPIDALKNLNRQPVKEDNGKRKRKSSNSGSDFDAKKGRQSKGTAAKKKCQNGSDSSNDSELETDNLSKTEPAKKAIKKGSKRESNNSSEEEPYKKGKRNSMQLQGESLKEADVELASPNKERLCNSSQDKLCKEQTVKEKRPKDFKVRSSQGKQDGSSKKEGDSVLEQKSPLAERGQNYSDDDTGGSVKQEQSGGSSDDARKKSRKSTNEKQRVSQRKITGKGQSDSFSEIEKSFSAKDSCGTSGSNSKKKNTVEGKTKRNLREKLSKTLQGNSSDPEKSPKKEKTCNTSEEDILTAKETDSKEKKKTNSKRKKSKKMKDLSSSDEDLYEAKKNKKRGTPLKGSNKSNCKQRRRGGTKKTENKNVISNITSSSNEVESEDLNSAGETSSDEQKIKPVTESLLVSTKIGFCQSSGVHKIKSKLWLLFVSTENSFVFICKTMRLCSISLKGGLKCKFGGLKLEVSFF